MRLLRKPPVFFGLRVVHTASKSGVDSNLFATHLCSYLPSTGREIFENLSAFPFQNLRISQRGREMHRDIYQLIHSLVCQTQERGTLLLSLPRGNSPAVALGHTPAVKIFLPSLFTLFLGGCDLVLRIELTVEHGVKLSLQTLSDFLVKIVFAVQVVQHQINEQLIGYLHIFHSLPFLSATIATVATVILTVSFSPLRPSQPSRSAQSITVYSASTTI